MELHTYRIDKSKSPFAPIFEFTLGIADVSKEINLDKLKKDLLIKEKELIHMYPPANDGGTNLGNDSVTTRYPHYTLWQFKEFSYLKSVIRKHHDIYCKSLNITNDKVFAQAWFNVMRLGEKIDRHQHNFTQYSYLSAHLTVNAEQTYTYYYEPYTQNKWAEKNENGKLTFFPSWVDHETSRVEKQQERITIALDIVNKVGFEEDIFDNKKHRWHELK